jgi:CheY-like chemotaxis protein
VDDEAALVHAIGEFLRESGFIVLDAFSSQDAPEIAKDHPGAIDILVTDVVMPGMRGPDLHRRVLELQPNLQVLFISGYAEGLPETKLPGGPFFAETVSILCPARAPPPISARRSDFRRPCIDLCLSAMK